MRLWTVVVCDYCGQMFALLFESAVDGVGSFELGVQRVDTLVPIAHYVLEPLGIEHLQP
jgi:hypothetical protein